MANYIRFDWAMKRLLRNKANYAVLEGLLTTLLNEKVTILLPIDSTPYADDDIPKHFRMNLLIAKMNAHWLKSKTIMNMRIINIHYLDFPAN